MSRFVAFLRAINVGGHTVKMEELRKIFESLGVGGVETFIASGNVIFESSTRRGEPLRKKIEMTLRTELGYEVATFLRSDAELKGMGEYQPFAASQFRAPVSTLFVALLSEELRDDAKQKLINHGGAEDEFHVHSREIYWLCHVRANESKFSGPKLEKTIGMRTTVRNINTIRRLAAKLAAA